MNGTGQCICLNMIVRNEAPVIRRCLASVLPLINTWVIVDTGSSDGTQQIIRDSLAALPGELHERPWLDFAHNRTEALALARGRADYILVIDADEVLEIDPSFTLPTLSHDVYDIQVRYGGTRYLRRQLLRDALPWRYEGVLHEYVTCEQARTETLLAGLTTVPFHDGARARDPETYRKDAALLEGALAEDPANTRYIFYLAQSYRDAGELEEAIRVYKRRAELGGWQEEVWYSLYQVAQLRQRLDHPWPEVMQDFLTAYNLQPHRAGPLYRIGMHYQAARQYALSYIFLDRARQLPLPDPSALFVEHNLYDFQIALDHAVVAFYVGDDVTAIRGNNQLLRSGKLPAAAIDQVIRNRRFSLDRRFPPTDPSTATPHVTVVVATHGHLGPELDDCLHSLLQQQHAPLRVIVLAEQADDALRTRVQLSPAFTLLERPTQTWNDVRDLLRDAAPHEVALLLPANARLATPDTLQDIATLFTNPACFAAYAQFRQPDGRSGNAMPPADRSDLNDLQALTLDSPLAVRNHLLQNESASLLTPASLLTSAGLDHLAFSDTIWTIRSAPTEAATAPTAPYLAGQKLPRISCLMVTLDRLALAKESIRSFARQTYPECELVIVTDGTPAFRHALERFVDALGIRAHVRFVYPPTAGNTLGHLRNLAMDAARGDILCQWDDDDINHPDRLLHQAQHLLQHNAGASFFADHLQLIEEQRALCWIDWTRDGQVDGPDQLFPGSLMMHSDARFRYPEDGPISRQGEDSALLHTLFRHTSVHPLIGAGHLYLYRFHGGNTFSREHHYHLANFRKPVEFLHAHQALLRAAARTYALPHPCCALGREGPAFLFD